MVMEIGHIVPICALDPVLKAMSCKYHLILTQPSLDHDQYSEWYSEAYRRGETVILDNDAYELKATASCVKLDMLARALDRLRFVTEVVLPDAFGDTPAERLYKASEGLAFFEKDDRMRGFMVVPVGQTLAEYLDCAVALVGLSPRIKCLGISFAHESLLGMPRGKIVRFLRQHPKLAPGKIDIHLLGESSSLSSLRDEGMRSLVRGIDTAKLVNWAFTHLEAVTATNIPEHQGRHPGYFSAQLHVNRLATARMTVGWWQRYLSR